MGIATALAAAVSAAVMQAPAVTNGGRIEERLEQALQEMVPPAVVAGRTYRPQPVTDLMRHENVPGISVAVVEDGRVVWARGFGLADRASGRAVTPETMFQAASISKPIVALAVMRLAQDGKLNLDEDVNRYLTSLRLPPPGTTCPATG